MGRVDQQNEEVRIAVASRRAVFGVLAVLTVLLLCGFGAERPLALGPGSLGRGDAAVASALSTGALWTNPAGLKRGRGQSFELGYLRSPTQSANSYFITSSDPNAPGGLAGGGSYGYQSGKLADGGTFTAKDIRLGMAAGSQGDVAGVLIGITWNSMSLLTKPKTGSATELGDWTGDVGMALDLASGLKLGAVLRNAFELPELGIERRIAGGLAYGGKTWVLEGAGSWTLAGDNPVYRLGGFVAIGDVALIRAGYVVDGWISSVARESVSLGGAISFGKARLDLGAEMNVDRPSEVRFGLSLVYFVAYAS